MGANRIVFNASDKEGFYEQPVTLPAGMVWNMDDALFAFIDAGLTWLLEEGNVDWDATGEMYNRPTLRADMYRARDLAREYQKDMDNPELVKSGAECLRLLADIGPEFLWD